MRERLLDLLACPACSHAPLRLRAHASRDGEVESGQLTCESCGAEYPIRDGIPCLLPPSLAAQQAAESEELIRKRSEMRARDEQVGDYDAMWYLNLFGAVEVPATIARLELTGEHTLLEAGCGTGRMTRRLAAQAKRLVAVDFSAESLRVNRRKLLQAGVSNVDLLQADICHLPFRSDAFDRVVSCQVLEHIPTPESRQAAVCELGRVIRPGGNLAISAYQYSLLMRLFGEKEGEHAGGIYFYRFTRDELHALLSRALQVEGITGALVYHYIARCRKGSS